MLGTRVEELETEAEAVLAQHELARQDWQAEMAAQAAAHEQQLGKVRSICTSLADLHLPSQLLACKPSRRCLIGFIKLLAHWLCAIAERGSSPADNFCRPALRVRLPVGALRVGRHPGGAAPGAAGHSGARPRHRHAPALRGGAGGACRHVERGAGGRGGGRGPAFPTMGREECAGGCQRGAGAGGKAGACEPGRAEPVGSMRGTVGRAWHTRCAAQAIQPPCRQPPGRPRPLSAL